MTAVQSLALGAAAAGLPVGSFLTVVIHRVPRQEAILSRGSRCQTCAVPLKVRHQIPLASWVALRGRCHECRSPIGLRYPLVEVGTALLFAAITLRFGVSPQLPAYLYLAALGLTLAMIDFDVRRLPDTIILPSYIVSVLLLLPAGAAGASDTVAVRALAGMVSLLVLFFALCLAYPNGLGFGDVKFAGLIGLYLGWLSWNALFLAAIGSFLIAAVGGLTAVATKHYTRNLAVPIGPCLTGSAVLALFVAAPISTWYGSLLAM